MFIEQSIGNVNTVPTAQLVTAALQQFTMFDLSESPALAYSYKFNSESLPGFQNYKLK